MSQRSNIGNIHAENTCSTTDVENNLVLEDMAVLVDGIAVRPGPDIIFLMREKKSVLYSIHHLIGAKTYKHLLVDA